MKLSTYFTLEELTVSETALRKGIDNTPPPDILENMKITAKNMDEVRKLLTFPIHVNSCYRGEKLNKAIGGSKTSAHMFGWAVDFVCPSFGTPKQIVDRIIGSNIKFDQCIFEGTWVHLSFDPKMRMQKLTAVFGKGGTKYVPYS